jgi:hypothetical protein
MTSDPPNVQLIGFEKDSELGGLFVQFGLFQDYKATLPDHLLGILRQQHPDIIIECIELLDVPKCKLGGMEQEQNKTLVRVQTLDVPLDLRVTVRAHGSRFVLDIQLVIKCEGLDSTPTIRSDMFVKAQRVIT